MPDPKIQYEQYGQIEAAHRDLHLVILKGRREQKHFRACPSCKGQGFIIFMPDSKQWPVRCDTCHGRGWARL